MNAIASSPAAEAAHDGPPWFARKAWQTQRSHSLLSRLWDAGLLEETLHLLSLKNKDEKQNDSWVHSELVVQRGLKNKGVETSTGSIQFLRQYHVEPWKGWVSDGVGQLQGLSEDIEEATAQKLRRLTYSLAMEANDIGTVVKLSNITNQRRTEAENRQRTEQNERRTVAAEKTVELRVYQTQRKAAEELDRILGEADRLTAIQKERAALQSGGAADAARIDAIQRRVYGPLAIMLEPYPDQSTAGGEAAAA